MSNSIETQDLSSGRILNESAIREHALECSQKMKGGRFTRVGEEFYDEVRADVECLLREIRNKWPTRLFEPMDTNRQFVAGALVEHVREALDGAVARLIQNKVCSHPSCGKTLSRTR